MKSDQTIMLTINGARRDVAIEGGETLLTVLRENLNLTGAKRGCNQGVCGSCTVEIDGWPTRACLTLAAGCEGRPVRTIEGGATDPIMVALQRQFVALGAVQCGFCTPGMLISARRLLADQPHPEIADVREALSGNICRCTGYRRIIDAVRAAAEDLAR